MLRGEDARILESSIGANESELRSSNDGVELETPEAAVVAHRGECLFIPTDRRRCRRRSL